MEPFSLFLHQAGYRGGPGNTPEHLPMGLWTRGTHFGWSNLCLWLPLCLGLSQYLPTLPWINAWAPSSIGSQLAQFKQYFYVTTLISLLPMQFLVTWKLCKGFMPISFWSVTWLGHVCHDPPVYMEGVWETVAHWLTLVSCLLLYSPEQAFSILLKCWRK